MKSQNLIEIAQENASDKQIREITLTYYIYGFESFAKEIVKKHVAIMQKMRENKAKIVKTEATGGELYVTIAFQKDAENSPKSHDMNVFRLIQACFNTFTDFNPTVSLH